METIFGAIIGVLGVIVGTFIGYFLSKNLIRRTHKNALQLVKITEFNKAAAAFQASFVNEIFLLRENILTGHKIPSAIIHADTLIAHEKAMIIFEPFVTASKREAFSEAWKNYKNSENIYCQQTPIADMNNRDFKPGLCRVFLTHINTLLDEFAKPK